MARTSSQSYIKLTGNHLRETEKAVHFEVIAVDGTPLPSPKTFWFPISQVKSMTHASPEDIDSMDEDVIWVADWICASKELI